MIEMRMGRGGEPLHWADKMILSNDSFPETATWMGFFDKETSEIQGIVVFTDYRGSTINVHVAGRYKGWTKRWMIQTLFNYVFNILKVNTAIGLVRIDNFPALFYDLKLGFRFTGVVPKGDDDGTDFYVLAMTKEQCKWIKKD